MPRASVARVEPVPIPDVEFGMEQLGAITDRDDAARMLGPLVRQYREWIESQRADAAALTGRRREVADVLVTRAEQVATRVQAGIDLMDDAQVRHAFQHCEPGNGRGRAEAPSNRRGEGARSGEAAGVASISARVHPDESSRHRRSDAH